MSSYSPIYKPGTAMPLSSLLSPPETKKHDSFSSQDETSSDMVKITSSSPSIEHSKKLSSLQLPRVYASPPISPTTPAQGPNIHDVEKLGNGTVKDPPLFGPDDNQGALSLNVPLFNSDPFMNDTDQAIDLHIASTKFNTNVKGPSHDDYRLVVSFRSIATEQALKNPKAWLQQEREFLERYKPPSKVTKKKSGKSLAYKAPKVLSRKLATATSRGSKSATKRTPQARVHQSFDDQPSTTTPKTIPRQRVNSGTTKSRNEEEVDTNFAIIPDYCPPLDTLDSTERNSLKTEWRSSVPPELLHDPNRHLLHEYEWGIASQLRLSCGRYLVTKRRIFQHRVNCLREGKKGFRKTDAQARCGIDVNKASKLWVAWEKVGWFDEHHFLRHLS